MVSVYFKDTSQLVSERKAVVWMQDKLSTGTICKEEFKYLIIDL